MFRPIPRLLLLLALLAGCTPTPIPGMAADRARLDQAREAQASDENDIRDEDEPDGRPDNGALEDLDPEALDDGGFMVPEPIYDSGQNDTSGSGSAWDDTCGPNADYNEQLICSGVPASMLP